MKKLRVTVDGKSYDVLVEVLDEPAPHEPRQAAWSAPVASVHVDSPSAGGSSEKAAPGVVPSPLAGKVVSIEVQPGQHVEAKQQLLTLEAMKMNTYVFAPHAGTIEAILVKPGDAVEEGHGLVRIGASA
jgi:biotin carboxyl carrier protein